jgi:uncharacterized protein Yka (UPF0111/DUF47 family)
VRLSRRRRANEKLLELFEESGRNAQRAALLLRDLVTGWPERAELARELLLCEHAGDRIAHDIFHRLAANGRRTPFEPVDIHGLASALDDIVDDAEEVADRFGLYAIEASMEQATELAEILVLTGEHVALSLHCLRRGSDMTEHLAAIHHLENEADRIARDAVASLFATGIDPMMVIRWKDVFDLLERSVDDCDRVANVLEGITLRSGYGSLRKRLAGFR